MISISGIEYQKELESLPYFNKSQAGILIGKEGKTIKAIRNLLKVRATLEKKVVNVVLSE